MKQSHPATPVVIAIPKNASTSLRKSLGWKLRSQGTNHVPLHAAAFQEALGNVPSPALVTAVRNPYDRAVSLFNYFKTPRRREAGLNVLLEQLTAEFPCASEFWERVNIKKVAQASVHFRPQSVFFRPEDDVSVLRFETLAADFRDYANRYNLQVSLKWANRSKARPDSLSRAAKARVANFYQDDFERFNYPL